MPFFVKRPGRPGAARSNNSYVRTLDVPSTIAEVLGARSDTRRRPLGLQPGREKAAKGFTLRVRDSSSTVSISGSRWRQLPGAWCAAAPARLRLGRASVSVHRNRPQPGPRGRRLAISHGRGPAGARSARGCSPTFARAFRRGADQIAGDLTGQAREPPRAAVALNGRVEAVGRSFYLTGTRREHFAFKCPSRRWREGRKRVELFESFRDSAYARPRRLNAASYISAVTGPLSCCCRVVAVVAVWATRWDETTRATPEPRR